MKYAIILLTLLSFLVLFYYLYIVYVGKKIAKKTRVSDRFIWASLTLLKTTDHKVNFKTATIFLDESNLYITKHNVFTINKLLSQNNYHEFITIPLDSISVFDYYNVHENTSVKVMTSILNRICIRNSFVLQIEYINEFGENISYKFSSKNTSADDFESIFIDIDHKIYKNRASEIPQKGLKAHKNDYKKRNSADNTTILKQDNLKNDVVKKPKAPVKDDNTTVLKQDKVKKTESPMKDDRTTILKQEKKAKVVKEDADK